ncbi:hypothetical protein CSKR_104163, partial [Clonorchis sinensis]
IVRKNYRISVVCNNKCRTFGGVKLVLVCFCLSKRLGAVGATRLPGWGPRDPHCAWLETLQDRAANRCQWRSCWQFLSRLPELSNKSWLYGSEVSVLNTNVLLSMMMMMMTYWGELSDRNVRSSNPTTTSRMTLSRLEQRSSVSALVLPSGGTAARHRRVVTAERLLLSIFRQKRIPNSSEKTETSSGLSKSYPALPPVVGCCFGQKAYPTQDWPGIRDACRSGIKPRSDWSKIWPQQPIMTQYWPIAGCQWCIQNASEFPESYYRLRYIYEALGMSAPNSDQGVSKKFKSTEPKILVDFPPVIDILKANSNAVKDRKDTSLPTTKMFIVANYKVDVEKLSAQIHHSIDHAVEKGFLAQVDDKSRSVS